MPTIINLQVATLFTVGVMLVGGGIAFGKLIQWQKDHQRSDDDRFKSLHRRIDDLKTTNIFFVMFVFSLSMEIIKWA